MPLFDGMVALVTGSGSEIGQAACHLYARKDAGVMDSDADRGINGVSTFVRAEVSHSDNYQKRAAAALDAFGSLGW